MFKVHEEKNSNGDCSHCGGGAASTSLPSNNHKALHRSHHRKGSESGAVKRISDYVLRTNIDVMVIGLVLACYHAVAYAADDHNDSGHDSHSDSASEFDPFEHTTHSSAEGGCGSENELIVEEKREVYALLFPWFAEIVGVVVYYVLSRYAHAIPYTAVMFIIGAFIGVSVQKLGGCSNALNFSASTWIGIEGEVILLVFLPGLLYLDSYNIDVHLFSESFFQLLTFAFPMVLAGTSLTALVAYFIFPYGWSFDLSMTFGSILAATDPVAVAVLLNELGAPPRLKMHISGESLLNDGSAVVFYHIFSLRFFYELGVEGFGEDVGWGEGFKLFFKLSLGGACIGIAFGVGLLIILFNLNRRLSGEDSVVQVVATITTAYLAFFTSEILAGCSGIIAIVFCGVTTKAFGETLYNDSHLSHHFWEITEYLLNTLLFALGGCVWGDVIAGRDYLPNEFLFGGRDWGFLFLLFIMVTIIRFFLVFSFYPITSRIGIGQNWREAVFMSYGGLRGAVGIALAMSLHAEIVHFTPLPFDLTPEEEALLTVEQINQIEKHLLYRSYSAKLFGFVGGIALLTLVINGPTCGPLLKKLGLVTPSETRQKVVENYRQHMTQFVLVEYVALLTEARFQDVDFTVVKDHIAWIKDINYDQLMAAVKRHKDRTPSSMYVCPNLKNVIPYVYKHAGEPIYDDEPKDERRSSVRSLRRSEMIRLGHRSARRVRRSTGNRSTVFDLRHHYDKKTVDEERLVFLKILRSAYHRLIDHGELETRGFIVHSLGSGLEYAEDAAARGLPLSDWNAVEVASNSFLKPAEHVLHKLFRLKKIWKHKEIDFESDFHIVQLKVRQILAFVHAHEWARKVFKEEFSKCGKGVLTAAEKIVLDECDEQIKLAENALKELDDEDVQVVKSHYVCHILLNRAAYYFKKLKKHGLMTEREAGMFLEEIEENIYDVLKCRETEHTNEMSERGKMRRLSNAPPEDLSTWNLLAEIRQFVDSPEGGDQRKEKDEKHEESQENKEHLLEAEKEGVEFDSSDLIISNADIEAMNAEM